MPLRRCAPFSLDRRSFTKRVGRFSPSRARVWARLPAAALPSSEVLQAAVLPLPLPLPARATSRRRTAALWRSRACTWATPSELAAARGRPPASSPRHAGGPWRTRGGARDPRHARRCACGSWRAACVRRRTAERRRSPASSRRHADGPWRARERPLGVGVNAGDPRRACERPLPCARAACEIPSGLHVRGVPAVRRGLVAASVILQARVRPDDAGLGDHLGSAIPSLPCSW
jgi:hypothetical protein